jgi:DNA-binding transcriptional regulator LsrR (DeoR family)
VYAFSGLRGDAKQLYTDVVNDKEPRMKLVRAETSRQQLQHIESADLVIWACGYQTKQLPVMDQHFKPVKLSGL